MPEPMPQPLDPYEPQTAYEWDDEEEVPEDRLNILWGRVAIFGASLLVAFLLGLWMAPNGIPESQVTSLKGEVSDLKNENEDLTKQLAAAEDAAAAAEVPSDAADATGDAATGAETTTDAGDTATTDDTMTPAQIYVVRPGDSLTSISEDFYGTTEYGDYLAELNGISDPEALQVGAELTVPEEPE